MPAIGIRNSLEDAGWCEEILVSSSTAKTFVDERCRYPASGSWDANFTSLTTTGNMWVYDTVRAPTTLGIVYYTILPCQELMGPWGADDSLHYWYDMGLNETLLEVWSIQMAHSSTLTMSAWFCS
jgi:hypothetical protein